MPSGGKGEISAAVFRNIKRTVRCSVPPCAIGGGNKRGKNVLKI